MAQDLFAVNGKYYNVAIKSLKTTANITDTDKAGRSISGTMIRDIIGTFIPVTMELEMKQYDLAEFTSLVKLLRQPVNSVNLTVIDLDGSLTFEAYVTKVEYEYQGMIGGVRRWSGLKVTLTPMAPNIVPA